ncbi:MAG: hypothetical protein FD123_1990 [Bacteroidetes bacterium]|nr:MAG: hypothetical protein FD123_1990 [Bacteroidota bacterium]
MYMRPFFLLLSLMICFTAMAQRPGDTTNYRREIIYKDKRFRVWNNWMTGGAGVGYNTKNPHMQAVIGLNFNFHIRARYFRLGGALAGDDLGIRNDYQFHGAWIFRRSDNERYHWAHMAGLSYSTMYDFLFPSPIGPVYTNDPVQRVGLYLESQLIRKILYDVGIGLSAYADINAHRQLFGLRADLYFSGAYRGMAKGGKRK